MVKPNSARRSMTEDAGSRSSTAQNWSGVLVQTAPDNSLIASEELRPGLGVFADAQTSSTRGSDID